MPASPVSLDWRRGVVEIDAAGAVTLVAGGLGEVGVRVAGLSRVQEVLADDDQAEHEARLGEATLEQRVTVSDDCQLRWVLDVPPGMTGELDLEVDPGGLHGWAWSAGADGLLALMPSGEVPALVLRAVRGELRVLSTGADRLRLAVSPRGLGAGRHVVVVRAEVVEAPRGLGTLLPSWYDSLVLADGEEWTGAIADFGLHTDEAVAVRTSEQDSLVRLSAPPGRHRVALHGPRGVTEVVLEVAPGAARALALVANSLDLAALDPAGAFVLHRAVASGVAERGAAVEDALDRFDWSRRPGLLALAFGAERAMADGEAAMAREAVRRLAAEPPAAGRARVAALVGLAASTLGEPVVLEMEAGADGVDALEIAVVLDEWDSQVADEVEAVMARLGSTLPGEPVGLDHVGRAMLAGLLDLVPEYWPMSWEAGQVAETTRRRILAAYAAGELTDPAPLAWLLVSN